jgi:hypothetical protein
MSSRGLKDLLTFEKGGQMGTEVKEVEGKRGRKKQHVFFSRRKKLPAFSSGTFSFPFSFGRKKGTSKEVRKK